MTFTVTFDIGTFSTNAGTSGIPAIFTGTGHAFLFLLSERAIATACFRFLTVRPDFNLSFLFRNSFITLAILFFDIFYPTRERAVGSRGRNYPQPRKSLMFALLTLPTLS